MKELPNFIALAWNDKNMLFRGDIAALEFLIGKARLLDQSSYNLKKGQVIMVIDIHNHIYSGRYDKSEREILKAIELYDISKVYVSGLGSGLYASREEIAECNMEAYRFSRENPGRIDTLCYVNPLYENCMEVLKRGVEEYGMSGMKILIDIFCDDPKVYPLMEKCIEYKIPVLIHCFYKAVRQFPHESTGVNVANLARRYPDAQLVMAHLGGNCYHGIKAVADLENVCVDFAGSIFLRDELDYTVKKIGADRVLFGTDMPGSFLVCYGQVLEADLTEEERNKIFYKNAMRIFGKGCWND